MSTGSVTWTWSDEPPMDDLSWSGVPRATVWPRSITWMRSASWSASSRYCVVSSTVLPSRTRPRMVSHIWPRVRGSSPVVGSSRKISGGRVIRLTARSRRRRMPPENCLMGLFAASVRSNASSSSPALRRDSARPMPCSRAKRTRFSVAVSSSSTEAYCPVTPSSCRITCGSFLTSTPKMVARPSSIGSRVASMESVVVLPAPFGPSTPNTSPRRTVRSTPSTARMSPNCLTSPCASTASMEASVMVA